MQDAAGFFPRTDVHPTVASYQGHLGVVTPGKFTRLLTEAGTIGFSVFPTEYGPTPQDWRTYGQAIAAWRIALPPP